jgi:histidine ammonia-lyase
MLLRLSMKEIALDGDSLRLSDLEAVAQAQAQVRLTERARSRVAEARAVVDRLAAGDAPIYGINTGFGKLAEVRIARHDLERLQRNLILSHSAGVGAPLPEPEVRALMLLRANVLAKGYSGIRLETLDLLLAALNSGVLPIVPERGSVGASGDLAPLAHLALLLIGEGDALFAGQRHAARVALDLAGLAPVTLQAKEGLALVNGTQAICAVGGLTLLRAERLAELADVCGAASVEGLLGSQRPFGAGIQALRPHPGQVASAAHLRALLAGSAINASHQEHCDRVQDAYSLRCIPQVHGAARDALGFARNVFEVEINAGTDNPLVFPAEPTAQSQIVSGGNFHGQPVSQAMDLAAIAMTELCAISERRIEQLVNPQLSGLPPFLAEHSGLNSGFMMAQVTAAALLSDCRILSHPASVDSVPTSANREDHVSMGMTAALKARAIAEHTRTLLAIELLVACQALNFRLPLRPAAPIERVWSRVRREIPALTEDRELHRDIQRMCELIDAGDILAASQA